MYTRFHSATGALITLALPNPIGVGLAFLSHIPADVLEEKKYDIKEAIIVEAVSHLVLLGVAYTHPHFMWLVLGMIAANGMDLWDKLVMKMLLKKPNFFWPHKGSRYFFFLYLNGFQTRLIENLAVVIAALSMLYLGM